MTGAGCMPGSQQRVKASQVRNYHTGGAACLHLSKSAGNVWLPLTMGVDCSRWYLKEKKNRMGREGDGSSEHVDRSHVLCT